MSAMMPQGVRPGRRHVSASFSRVWHAALVSFDVFVQGFIAGESSEHGGSLMREVLAPYVRERKGSFSRGELGDRADGPAYVPHSAGTTR